MTFPLVAFVAVQAAMAMESSQGRLAVTGMAAGLVEPWSLAFLPDGGFLVTERDGRLTRFPPGGGAGRPVAGLPAVFAEGQGGLFDVLVPRDFARGGRLFLSLAAPVDGGGATAIWSARLEGDRLLDGRFIFVMNAASDSGRHFGGRLVEARDGTLFLTIGDRGTGPDGMEAQDPASHAGKIVRIAKDGSVPPDNPFAGGPAPEIWSAGHRNPQGAALDAQGDLWVSAHGAAGGDEIDRVPKGVNHGWPVISYGTDYDGSPIGVGTAREGLAQPDHYWDPSIAPSGHAIHSGRLWPDWAGDHFIGSLKFDYIARMDPDRPGPGGWAEEALQSPETIRVRDVREAPDGSIWFLSVGNGAVYRIAPPGR
ncbi:MAG: PQQ-dependent sugar dehydrogenase [Rhodobacteraceae bacterium]|nr:PQQ-dependent sugar dehydrogenase [Paracoccaceae bacterium]